MKPSRPRKSLVTAGLLTLLVLSVAVLPGAAAFQEQPAKEKTEKSEKSEKSEPAKASEETRVKLPSSKGVVLRPKAVDGTVSAYAAAVRKPDPEARVFTNADLEQLWAGDTGAWATTPSSGGSSDAAPTPGAQTPLAMDPLEYLKQQEGSAADRRTTIAEAERELAAARAEVDNLEKQLLAIRNPFSARPELSEDEKEARDKDTSVAERLARTEERLALARERVAAAERKLAGSRR